MDLIFSASIIAAFFAGMVALFAPCCITVLLPAYLASAFREKRHILKMTFVFGLGAFLGKGMTLIPMPKRMMPNIDMASSQSVFMLGLFSGAATSCCAPVLAGAVTLAVISGVFWKALVVTFAYTFGMTFPLFITALIYDRFKLEESRLIQGKLFEVRVGQKTIAIHSTNLLAGGVFLIMGVILLILGTSGNAYWAPESQVAIGNALNRLANALVEALMRIPDAIWGGVIIGFFLYLMYRVRK